MKAHKFVVIGLLIIIVGAFILAEANSKYSACESIPGKIIQLLDKDQQSSCKLAHGLAYLSYVLIGIGVMMAVTGIIRKGN
ncbi:hypothetical protein ACFL3V_07290 [Nanoarchaeota archaeon]